jgi:hypothetical protein
MDKQLHISAKNKTDLLPNEGVLHAASAGGVGFTPQGSRITVDIVNRAARYEMPCVKGGTHSQLSIKWFAHDFGGYCEVVCYFNTDIEASVEYAQRYEDDAPATWEG